MHILSACEHRCEKREEGFPACLSACQISYWVFLLTSVTLELTLKK